ncbi:MAG: hypothetical protein IKW85_05410 [Muribaculaceae bacterium]|nr:hypothetical protein [Muribaculaceae bacterium]
MKHAITIIITAMLTYSMTLSAQKVETFVRSQLAQYPQSRLLDLYKSSFQDFMGAEHLVNDTASARAYLEQELAQCETMELLPWYSEPCGPNGNHVRVSLRAVLEGHISADALLSAFIASANTQSRPTVEQWSTRWRDMMAVIDRMELDLPHYDEDRQFIDEVLNQGKYAISHSTDYREAYSPHYRIIAREIFERDIKPLLPHPCCCH